MRLETEPMRAVQTQGHEQVEKSSEKGACRRLAQKISGDLVEWFLDIKTKLTRMNSYVVLMDR